MILYTSETDFVLDDENKVTAWLGDLLRSESKIEGEINYVFCSDEFLLKYNIKYLKHNTLTDIISFDYTVGNEINGDVFISIERVKENALLYKVSMRDELHRVMAHGLLHYCGYKDKTTEDKVLMREKEDYYLSLRSF
ncbi:rRNA maturation RNase YbeY [Flavobacteriaceae bacterium F08102]|nr:rRNA maturation RNase YbeY [Flavobacteriaceae bacterium F08102]